MKTDIFHLNHMDKSINDDKLLETKTLYKHYCKRFWCYKKAFKYFKRINLFSNITSTGLVAVGTIAGGATLNPIILATISSAGLSVKTFSEIKNYKKKIEMSKFAYTTYKKVLVNNLRSCLRGNEFNHTTFINDMKMIDEIIIDLCPLTDKFEKPYNKKFTSE